LRRKKEHKRNKKKNMISYLCVKIAMDMDIITVTLTNMTRNTRKSIRDLSNVIIAINMDISQTNVMSQAPIGQTQMIGHQIGHVNQAKFKWRGVEKKIK
jgi:hypothetical protein